MKKLTATLVLIGILALGVTSFAATTIVDISATVTGTCKFTKAGTVSFTLNPSTGGLVNGSVTQPEFWCTKGTAYSITDDNGINKSGTTYRMKHETLGEYIAYSFTYPTKTGTGSGKTTSIVMDIAASVAEAAYLDATSGTYTDTITLTITP